MTALSDAVDDYIHNFPVDVRNILKHVRETVNAAAPEAIEAMSYGVPTLKQNGKMLLNYAAYKQHIGLYPSPEIIDIFKDELTDYDTSKGTIRFMLDAPIPYDLITRITEYRVNQFQSE